MKTNAARLLDKLGISYELRDYEVDPDDLSAENVAAKVGMPPEQVFKTLVARGDRKVDTVPLKEVQPLTGYVRGGVTVFGAKKAYPVYVDETMELFDVVAVSAGVRGTQILIRPEDYLRAAEAKVGPIARPKE